MLWVMIALLPADLARADALREVERATGGEREKRVSREGARHTDVERDREAARHVRGGSSHVHRDRDFVPSDDPASCGGDYGESCDDGSGSGGFFGAHTDGKPQTFLFMATLWLLAMPVMLPLALDDEARVRYAPHPFADGPGILRLAPEVGFEADSAPVHTVALALDAESGYMLAGVVPGSLALRLMLPRRVELDARVSLMSDVYDPSVGLASAATAHLSYRFAQARRFDVRGGLGMRMFALDAVRLGVDFVYAADTYIARNWVWRMELHLGNAGSAVVGQVRTTLGAMIGRWELYAGYDHTAYRSGEAAAARLSGPVAGLRGWF